MIVMITVTFFLALHADLFQSNVNLAQVLLEPRSLLVMSGEAYELYVHRIDHAKARDEDEKGTVLTRHQWSDFHDFPCFSTHSHFRFYDVLTGGHHQADGRGMWDGTSNQVSHGLSMSGHTLVVQCSIEYRYALKEREWKALSLSSAQRENCQGW